MDPEKKVVPPVDDEANLDKEIEDSIDKVRAGESIEDKPPAKTKEEGPEATGETGAAGPDSEGGEAGKPKVADKKEEGYEFRIPNKGKFESDESFEKRIELLDLVKKRKAATTPEAKAALSEEIKKAKGQLKTLNGADKNINNLNKIEKKEGDEDPALVADRERLKALGGVTKEDMQETIRQERFEVDQKSTLESFVARHPEFKDEDVREVFFDFVDNNYNWNNKAGKELMTVLELARENMFKPSETIQERVLKGANVQEKVNAMNFPGGTGGGKGLSSEQRKSVDELKATGMSEEKALELISE